MSLIGSKGRGALSADELAKLEAGELVADDSLDASDVLMEVIAEDHRHKLVKLEFATDGGGGGGRPDADDADDDDGKPLSSGPRLAHRRYLTAPGVGPGTVFQRQEVPR